MAQLGNSHVLAVTEALADIKCETAAITSFPMFHDWRVASRDGSPVITINASEAIDIPVDAYDIFVVSAAGWWAARNEHLQRQGPMHPLAFVRCVGWTGGRQPGPAHLQLVSQAAFDRMIDAWVKDHAITRLVRYLATTADKSVVWLSWPPPSRALLRDAGWLLNVWYGDQAAAVWRAYRAAEQSAVHRLSSEFGENVTLLPAPCHAADVDGFLNEDLAAADPFHANASYGKLIVQQLSPLLR